MKSECIEKLINVFRHYKLMNFDGFPSIFYSYSNPTKIHEILKDLSKILHKLYKILRQLYENPRKIKTF